MQTRLPRLNGVFRYFAICFLSVLPVSTAQAAIFIDGYTAATNDRFTNDAAFIMAGFDVSGVGQNGIGRWATAISRNVVVSAVHFPPSGTVSFYEGNDSSTTPVKRQIASTDRVAGTDIWLGVLDSPLPNSINHYSFADEVLSTSPGNVIDAGSLQGLNANLFGLSPEPPADRTGQPDQAVGRNLISGYAEDVNVTGIQFPVDSLLFDFDSPGVDFEARFRTGDSGGPTFIDVGGELVLLGTNAFASTEISGISYIGNHAEFVNEFIAANAVPEPSALGLAGLGASGLWGRRRRRS
ncbi:MAG: PEP-CTERM sorting domain-containing protein [Aureliella sp.]